MQPKTAPLKAIVDSVAGAIDRVTASYRGPSWSTSARAVLDVSFKDGSAAAFTTRDLKTAEKFGVFANEQAAIPVEPQNFSQEYLSGNLRRL